MVAQKTALITGSTSGIGLGIATALAQSGANVVINGICDPATADEICLKLNRDFGVKVMFDGADMSKPEAISGLIQRVEDNLGYIDILVNNAGIQYVAPVDEFPAEKWDLILAINLSSAFHTTRHCVPRMRDKGWGRIINVASAHALVASPFKSAYVAAKHGIAGLTKTVALETAEFGITVNAICPGYVMTPLVEKQIPDQAKARGISEEAVIRDVLLAAQSTKKFVTVDELSALSLFLCSDAARSITGALLPVDGGWTAH